MRSFDDAIGIYLSRIKESPNPLYWLDLVICLPKNALCYLGAKPETVIIKILQIVWWIAVFTVTLFKPEIVQLIRAKIF